MDRRARAEQRRTRRVLRQMDRAARRGHRSSGRSLLSLLTVVCVALGGVWLAGAAGWQIPGVGDLVRPRAYVEIDGRALAVPRPERSEGRLLTEVPVTSSGAHAFLHTTPDGGPVGYDPCRPVRYVVRPDNAPRAGQALIEDALGVVSDASGVLFLDTGGTGEDPRKDRPLIQTERYGDGWAPVLVAWADEDEVPELAGQVAGVGGSAAVPGSDGEGSWLAAGRIVLDAPDITALLGRTDGYEQARAIVVHELAHVLGLDHVDDPTELMHPMTSLRTDLGPGDRQGLALLGQVPCEE